MEVAGQTDAIAAGALDTDQHDGAEALQPAQELAIAGPVGGKRLAAQEPADGAEGGGYVDVEVGSTPPVMVPGTVVTVRPFSRRVGLHQPAGTADKPTSAGIRWVRPGPGTHPDPGLPHRVSGGCRGAPILVAGYRQTGPGPG